MARYSSDSDSDGCGKYKKKTFKKSRSSSSGSSDSSSYKKRSTKHSKVKRRHRSRSKSRDNAKSSTSYRSSPSRSKDKDRRRYKSKRSPSTDKNKKKFRSLSREKSTSQSCIKLITERTVNIKDEFSIEPRVKKSILEEINADSFAPKQFTSSASSKDRKINNNIVIDIAADTIHVPLAPEPPIITETIFHTSITIDQEARLDKWVRKLYNLRQKAMAEMMSNGT